MFLIYVNEFSKLNDDVLLKVIELYLFNYKPIFVYFVESGALIVILGFAKALR